jgi:hypothetical protein
MEKAIFFATCALMNIAAALLKMDEVRQPKQVSYLISKLSKPPFHCLSPLGFTHAAVMS